MQFRIYLGQNIAPDRRRFPTETVTREQAAEIVSATFPCFTVYQTGGYWHGQAEPSLVFEILSDDSPKGAPRIAHVARTLQSEFRQDSVYVSESVIHFYGV